MDNTILVVDDEADLATSYERLLKRQGFQTVAVGSCAAGLAALPQQPWRLVIIDLRLPDGDGLDLVRAARALPDAPPVLVASVLGSRATRQSATAAGATAFLTKPFTTESFTRTVRDLLDAPAGEHARAEA